jgi:NTE family protein
MGAYVGGLWSAGINGRKLEELAADMGSSRDLWKLVDPVLPPRRGFIGGEAIRRRLEGSLGNRKIEDFVKPFATVATRLDTLERDVLNRGNATSAILASLAVPGIVAPVKRGGFEYIDGGVCDPLPVDVLKELWGVDLIIAVNVLPPPGALREMPRPDKDASLWRRVVAACNRHLNYFAPGNLLDILRYSAMGSQMRLVERSARRADVLISPVSESSGWHDYHRSNDYIELGRASAMEALPRIEAMLAAREESESNHWEELAKVSPCI